MADADYYAIFINALRGLIYDAELSNYEQNGIVHLREALEYFSSDYRILNQTSDVDSGSQTE